MRLCLTCKTDINDMHLNAVRCSLCAGHLRKKPPHKLTKLQQKEALKLAGTMYRHDIALKIGCSRTSLNRFAEENKQLNWNFHRYDDKTIKKVCDYYLNHTLEETQKKFPDLKARSIVDRYLKSVKCFKYTDDEILILLKYTGLVSWPEISAKLGRSCFATRRKLYRTISGRVNGLPFMVAKNFVKNGCPFFHIKLNLRSTGLWISPWTELSKHLKTENPSWVNQAFLSLAQFQRWLLGSDERVLEIIQGKL